MEEASDPNLSPIFSIVMPAYNVGDYIDESIRSVLHQEFERLEIIVVDDGSTDGTKEIVHNIIENDCRVRLIENANLKGPAGARNSGAKVALGEWLCFLDSDDVLSNNALAVRYKAVELNPQCDFFSTDFMFWYPDSNKNDKKKTDTSELWKIYFNQESEINRLVSINKPMKIFLTTVLAWTGGVTMRRSLFNSLEGFDETLPRAEDDHLWLRVAAKVSVIVLINEVTAYYRQRSTGITQGTGSVSPYAPIMFRRLLKDELFKHKKKAIFDKMARHLYINCLHYRAKSEHFNALVSAFQYWLCYPCRPPAIRNLIACFMLRK